MSEFVRISATWDARQVKSALAALAPRQWAFATALTLSRVGRQVKAGELMVMRRVFDRPTTYTLNSLMMQPATRQQLEARVWFRDFSGKGTVAADYLLPQVYGGTRRQKRFERRLQAAGFLTPGHALVPARGAPLDAYGNVQRGVYSRVLSQLQAQFDPLQNETARSRRRSRGRRPSRFFYGAPGATTLGAMSNYSRTGNLGVWERVEFAFGSAVRPVFLEHPGPKYRKRFAFFAIAENIAKAHYGREFDKAAEQTLRTAR